MGRGVTRRDMWQGEWKPKRIANKAYKGKWVAPDIDNPDFVDDPELYAVVKDNGLVGFELWQVGPGGGHQRDSDGPAAREAALACLGSGIRNHCLEVQRREWWSGRGWMGAVGRQSCVVHGAAPRHVCLSPWLMIHENQTR